MKLSYLAVLVGALILTVLIKNIIPGLTYDAYKDTLGALLNISSIIFAIVGAWIAIIYPKAIDQVFHSASISAPEIKSADKDTDYLSELLEIVVVSALVLMAVLSIQFCAPLIKAIPFGDHLVYLKYCAFYTICILTFMQLLAVFRVVLANYRYLAQLRKKNRTEKFRALAR